MGFAATSGQPATARRSYGRGRRIQPAHLHVTTRVRHPVNNWTRKRASTGTGAGTCGLPGDAGVSRRKIPSLPRSGRVRCGFWAVRRTGRACMARKVRDCIEPSPGSCDGSRPLRRDGGQLLFTRRTTAHLNSRRRRSSLHPQAGAALSGARPETRFLVDTAAEWSSLAPPPFGRQEPGSLLRRGPVTNH